MTHSRQRIRELLGEHHLAPRRGLGQNFVADANTVRRIAHLAAVGPGDHVVEIGAGLGSLTLALAETGATVTAVEVDEGLTAALRTIVEGIANVQLVEGDAMVLDWDRVSSGQARRCSSPTSRTTSPRRSSPMCSTGLPRSSGCW